MLTLRGKALSDLIFQHIRWSCMDQKELKSLKSKMEFLVRFYNKTDRTIDVIWMDFNGTEVLYKCLKPKQFFDCGTFVNHVWIAVDSQSRSQMYICKMPFFVMTRHNLLKLYVESRNIGDHFFQFRKCLFLNISEPVASLKHIAEIKLVECFLKSNRSFFDLVNSLYSLGIPKQIINDAFYTFGFAPSELHSFDRILSQAPELL